MEIKFKNGSTIKTIETKEKSTKSKSRTFFDVAINASARKIDAVKEEVSRSE